MHNKKFVIILQILSHPLSYCKLCQLNITGLILGKMTSSNTVEDIWSELGETQAKMRTIFGSGLMTPEEEINSRISLANLLRSKFEEHSNASDLFDAIEHLEGVIPHLPKFSTDRLKYLNELSYMKMSAFEITNSSPILDESIAYARQAKAELQSGDDPILYKIYHNLGYSLSRHAQLEQSNQAVLDEAIACGRHVLHLAPQDSTEYQTTVTNLAARLTLRYGRDHRTSDYEEALVLVRQQLKNYPPGTPQHGTALLTRGDIACELYSHTNDMKDLDEAIIQKTKGRQSLPPKHEANVHILKKISWLYEQKFHRTSDPSDMQQAIKYFGLILESVPSSHPVRADFVVHHLNLIKDSIASTHSTSEVRNAMEQANHLRRQVPTHHAKRHASGLAVGGLLARAYTISHQLYDLIAVVSHATEVCHEFNKARVRQGTNKIDLSPLQDLFSSLAKLSDAPESPKKKQALESVYGYFCVAYESKELMKCLATLQLENREEIVSMVKTLHSSNLPSHEKVIQPGRSDDSSKDLATLSDPPKRPFKPSKDYHNTITGLRNFAFDGTNTVLTLEAITRDAFGYGKEEDDPRSRLEFVQREDRLEQEFFEKEQREHKNPNPRLCRLCRWIKPLVPQGLQGFVWNSKIIVPFGHWDQLTCRRHCSICQLILSLMTVGNQGRLLHPRLHAIDQEIQGIQFNIQRLPTGETLLGVEYGLRPIGALRILASSNHTDALRQGWQTCSSPCSKVHSQISTGLNSSGGQLVNLGKVRSWLDNCVTHHARVCNSFWGEERCASNIPLLLIDVMDYCLVSSSSAERYFALSYVWGKVNSPSTLVENVQERFEKGSLISSSAFKLPKTIEDAMLLVQSLGERYLWVDSLCIVQDDRERKHDDIHRMDIVYSKAFATIAATHGKDSNAGLPGIRPDTRPTQQIESFQVSGRSSDLGYREDAASNTELVELVSTPPPLALVLETAEWDSRGWVLQEQLLSRRCIYFSSSYVYFQCNQETLCEITLEGPTYMFEQPVQRISYKTENPLTDLKRIGLIPGSKRIVRIFETYTKLVELYTIRQLTVSSDILNGFAGILAVLAEYSKCSFVSGLPAAALDLALLWTPANSRLRRRLCYKSDPNTRFPAEQDSLFPSWSWAGWDKPVDYRLPGTEEKTPPSSQIDMFNIHHHGISHTINGRKNRVELEFVDGAVAESGEHTARYLLEKPMLEIEQKQINISGPDFGPNVLQFWADAIDADLFHFHTNEPPDYLSKRNQIHSKGLQALTRIRDSQHRHCGLSFHVKPDLPTSARQIPRAAAKKAGPRELVAISLLGNVTNRRTGPNRVEGEIDLFDREEFCCTGPGSGMVNVLIIEWDSDIARRVTIAQIHIQAWKAARPRRKHIRLA